MHLSTNILADRIIPADKGSEETSLPRPMRGAFEENLLPQRGSLPVGGYRVTDYFFGLSDRRKQYVEHDCVLQVFSPV